MGAFAGDSPRLPLRAVRELFLERQHLDRPRARALTPHRLGRFVEDAGGLQIDSINVLDRAHYLTVWSRFGPYDRARFDRIVYRRRLLFEYWAHAACLVPVSSLPWWRRAMLDYETRHTGWSGLQRNAGVLREVRAAIRAGGPMVAAELETRRRRGARGGWWAWRPVHHALHHLWMTGDLAIHSRRHFQKRFDLAERVLGETLAVRPVTTDEFRRWHLERSLHAMGAVTEKDLSGYLTFPAALPSAAAPPSRRCASAARWCPSRWKARARRGGRWRATCPRCAEPAGDGRSPRAPRCCPLRFPALVPRPRGPALRFRVPHRGVHPGPEARARLLHPAHPPRRSPHRPPRRQDAPRREHLEVRHAHFEPLAGEGPGLTPWTARYSSRTPRSMASPRPSCRWASSWARGESRSTA